MYLLRFKRHKQSHAFIEHSLGKSIYHWVLTEDKGDAAHFETIEAALSAVAEIIKIDFPARAFNFTASTLFLMQLYGDVWDDSVEGMVLEMDDVIKAQIIELDSGEVIQTVRMRNPLWEKHYA